MPDYTKNILFTAYYLNYFSGSQIHVFEMAEYLSQKDGNVQIYIVSPNISDEIALLAQKKKFFLFRPDELPRHIIYDIVFALHSPVLSFLLGTSLKYKKIINVILSPFAELEKPAPFHRQLSLLVANSEETKQKLIETDKIPEHKIFVLPNFLPDNFIGKAAANPKLKRIAVISNHVPDELKLLPGFFKDTIVDFIGIEYAQKQVSPKLLSQYDLIISIGKTVQYSLGMCIPIYEYDKFGGCGYINLGNFNKEASQNFSGRATRRKLSAAEIADEIKNGYQKAVGERAALQKAAVRLFSIHNIDTLMSFISQLPDTPEINVGKQSYLPLWLVRFLSCFIPVKKARQNFRRKYRRRV